MRAGCKLDFYFRSSTFRLGLPPPPHRRPARSAAAHMGEFFTQMPIPDVPYRFPTYRTASGQPAACRCDGNVTRVSGHTSGCEGLRNATAPLRTVLF